MYKLPSEPTRYRASVWRKLKGAGAVYLQNGVAALPAYPGAERVMRSVTQEIRKSEGIASLLRGEAVVDEAGLIEASTRRGTPSTQRLWRGAGSFTPS